MAENIKPGYKTTEFWITLVVTLAGILMSSGIVVEGSLTAQIIGGILSIFSSMGYTAARTRVKCK